MDSAAEKNTLKHVLIVDDEENMRHLLSVLLTGEGYQVETAADGQEAIRLLENKGFDFVLCDVRMPEMDGPAFLKAAESIKHRATIIMMSAFGSVDTALAAMKQGAYDFISKPFKTDEVVLVLKKAEEREQLRRENIRLQQKVVELERKIGFGTMIGKSKAMQEVFTLADKVAEYPTTVLITGESGTGKELVAAGIHAKSGRADKPFIAVNCGSVPENLLESELFGHKKGSFTGADKDRKGLLLQADGGTLFLDEVGDMSLSAQAPAQQIAQERLLHRLLLDQVQDRLVEVAGPDAVIARVVEPVVTTQQHRQVSLAHPGHAQQGDLLVLPVAEFLNAKLHTVLRLIHPDRALSAMRGGGGNPVCPAGRTVSDCPPRATTTSCSSPSIRTYTSTT